MDLEPVPGPVAEVIEETRALTREMAARIASHGLVDADILIGIAYGLNDLAIVVVGDPAGAIEWQRSALDLFERNYLGRHHGPPPQT